MEGEYNMCGIVAAIAFGELNEEQEKVRQGIMKIITTELLIATEARGKDATGAAILFNDGKFIGMKRGDRATAFLSKFGASKECYGGLLKVWSQHTSPVKIYLGHCRQGTIGDKEENENNHPIKIGNLVGVHNGIIRNDDKIIENLGCHRDGKVDSESIFRLFTYFTNEGKEPFTMEMIQNIVDRLEGQFTVAIFNADNPYQLPVFRDGRPAEFVFIRDYGILFVMSDSMFWNPVHFAYERCINYYGTPLPSLLDCEIEKKQLPDDSCMIFDLTINVDKKTEIDNLGEWKKMERTNKIWKSSVASKMSIGTGPRTSSVSYIGNNKSAASKSVYNPAANSKKRRVFSSLKNRYIVKSGDTILEDDKSILLPVDTKAGNNKIKTDQEKATKTSEAENEVVDKKLESVKSKVTVTDLTIYDANKNKQEVAKNMRRTNIIEKDKEKQEDSVEITNGDTIEVVEVIMEQPPAEIVESATKAYESLDPKGYGKNDMDKFLSDAAIKDEETAKSLDVLVIANRVFKYVWKAGFIEGCLHTLKINEIEKKSVKNANKREKHIVNLKTLVVLLARFFSLTHETKPATIWTEKAIENKLETALTTLGKEVNTEQITFICNAFENKEIKRVTKIIDEIQQKQKGRENN